MNRSSDVLMRRRRPGRTSFASASARAGLRATVLELQTAPSSWPILHPMAEKLPSPTQRRAVAAPGQLAAPGAHEIGLCCAAPKSTTARWVSAARCNCTQVVPVCSIWAGSFPTMRCAARPLRLPPPSRACKSSPRPGCSTCALRRPTPRWSFRRQRPRFTPSACARRWWWRPIATFSNTRRQLGMGAAITDFGRTGHRLPYAPRTAARRHRARVLWLRAHLGHLAVARATGSMASRSARPWSRPMPSRPVPCWSCPREFTAQVRRKFRPPGEHDAWWASATPTRWWPCTRTASPGARCALWRRRRGHASGHCARLQPGPVGC